MHSPVDENRHLDFVDQNSAIWFFPFAYKSLLGLLFGVNILSRNLPSVFYIRPDWIPLIYWGFDAWYGERRATAQVRHPVQAVLVSRVSTRLL